jgi:ATP-dependent protease ClpP protease subunit
MIHLMNLKRLKRNKNRRAFQEEEAKKVFVIINSFGGSVGNGITVHDALQFIKAGSLTFRCCCCISCFAVGLLVNVM